MSAYWSAEDVTLHLGDCRKVLPELEAESIDAIVTDPPYDLTDGGKGGFMGRTWDATGVAFDPVTWQEAYRVLKPGGWVVAFGGTRTWHRLVCAIEDAGFEIRDSIHWIYSQGMPKGLDVSKAIDKAAGVQREVLSEGAPLKRMIPGADQNRTGSWIKDNGREFVPTVTAPGTPEAAEWAGWNIALKPAHEPIVLARKPLTGTVVENVIHFGTGALNIDACRVQTTDSLDGGRTGTRTEGWDRPWKHDPEALAAHAARVGANVAKAEELGRWPANVVFSHSEFCQPAGTRTVRSDSHHPASRGPGGLSTSGHAGQDGLTERKPGTETVEAWDCAPGCVVAELDRQSGVLTSGANPERRSSDKFRDAYGDFKGQPECTPRRGVDTGGASRFFPVFRYQAKATTAERPRLPDGTAHETVKPLPLITWLLKLVSRPGAVVLDMFAGSGTTGEACLAEGRQCVLVELEERSCELIKVRLRKPIQPGLFDLEAS